ncbi:aldose 1-epimerase family protein [Phycicoccus ginsengisoli]
MSEHPSGEQWTIRHGRHEVTVVEVGGGLRSYTLDGVDVMAGYAVDEMATSGRGQVLIPWPNRIRDGRYTFEGKDQQLALTEPALHNASHGLVRWVPWRLVEQAEDSLTVALRLHPQPGWDGVLDLTVTYAVGAEGLSVSTRVLNTGAATVPFGYGAHPYLALGSTPLADVVLHLPASQEVLVDERMLPTGTAPVRPETDFRSARPLGSTSLDTGYTGVDRDPDTGRWTVTLSGLRDRGDVSLWGDESFDWFQVFTVKGADDAPGVRGIAVEPMSCPADAFNSGQGVVVLTPGDSWSGTWGISPSTAAAG